MVEEADGPTWIPLLQRGVSLKKVRPKLHSQLRRAVRQDSGKVAVDRGRPDGHYRTEPTNRHGDPERCAQESHAPQWQALSGIVALQPCSVMAWRTEGHRIVAAIAKTLLEASARARVDASLATEPGATLSSSKS
jgi:hypothetical protein